MGTLINPQRPKSQDEADFYTDPVYLRNPETGMVFKLYHKDTIARCRREFYTQSSEAELREQAIELAELQGRPLPPWAPKAEATPAPVPAAEAVESEPDDITPPRRAAAMRAAARG